MLRSRDLASSTLPALADSEASAIVWNGPGLPSNLSRCANTESGWHANKPRRIGSPSLPTFDASGLVSGIIIVIANAANFLNRPIFRLRQQKLNTRRSDNRHPPGDFLISAQSFESVDCGKGRNEPLAHSASFGAAATCFMK